MYKCSIVLIAVLSAVSSAAAEGSSSHKIHALEILNERSSNLLPDVARHLASRHFATSAVCEQPHIAAQCVVLWVCKLSQWIVFLQKTRKVDFFFFQWWRTTCTCVIYGHGQRAEVGTTPFALYGFSITCHNGHCFPQLTL